MRLANTMVTTLRLSRACVHSDWIVYIALPSPTTQITLRSGQAIAAPVATGVENPIEPPMFCSQSCGLAADVGGPGTERIRQCLQCCDRIFAPRRQAVDLAALGLQLARLVRIGKERDGIVGLDQDDVL